MSRPAEAFDVRAANVNLEVSLDLTATPETTAVTIVTRTTTPTANATGIRQFMSEF